MDQNSIEVKLNYLNDTKQLIKDAIIEKGQEITSQTPFREYVDKIKLIETGSGIKQFASIEEMNQSTDNKKGDLAIIYANMDIITNGDTESIDANMNHAGEGIYFPETVTLPEPLEPGVDYGFSYESRIGLTNSHGHINLDSANFIFDQTRQSGGMPVINPHGSIVVIYTSDNQDGIHYRRTTFESVVGNSRHPLQNPINNFNGPIQIYGPIKPEIGYFMQVKKVAHVYEGLYEYDGSTWILKEKAVKNQEKIITDNGVYVPQIGYTGFDKVTVNVPKGVDTSDATATTSDIKSGSTAYVKDTKLTGTLTFDKFNPDYSNCLDKASQIEGSIPLENPYFVKSLTNQDIEPDKYKSNIRTWITEIPKLDTSNVTNMHYMFANCTNLTTIPVLDTSKVTDMGYMFTECSSLTEIPLIDTSKVTSMTYMFSECSSLTTIPLLNTSNVTNMERMFFRSNLTSIPLIDTSNVTNMYGMFDYSDLTTIPQLDTSNVTNMTYMFANCTKLTTIPLLNTSNVTNMTYMFANCTKLTTIPLLNTSNVTNMYRMFDYCTKLTTIPLLNTSNVTNMEKMFTSCYILTTIPLLDTSRVTNMYYMFRSCSNLVTIPILDTSNVTNMTWMFEGCSKLSDESLNNILQMCINAVSYTKTKTLDNIGLSREQVARCESLSNWQAFLDAGWAA